MPAPVTSTLVLHFLSIAPVAAALGVAAVQWRHTRFRHTLYMVCGWTCLIANIGLVALGRYLEVASVVLVGRFAWILYGLFLILLLDSVSRESPDSRKLLVWALFAGILLVLWFNLDAASLHRVLERDPGTGGSTIYLQYQVFWILNGVNHATIGLFFTARIYARAPRKLKRPAGVLLGGAIVHAPLSLILLAWDPRIVYELTMGLGVFLMAGAMVREPRIAFILPYQVHKLVVVETRSGIPLFSHAWVEAPSDIGPDLDLISGFLHGIGVILNETLQGGHVQYIKVEQAILSLVRHPELPFVSILFASRPSRVLRQALERFTTEFGTRFGSRIGPDVTAIPEREAARLVEDVFPFIPDYTRP